MRRSVRARRVVFARRRGVFVSGAITTGELSRQSVHGDESGENNYKTILLHDDDRYVRTTVTNRFKRQTEKTKKTWKNAKKKHESVDTRPRLRSVRVAVRNGRGGDAINAATAVPVAVAAAATAAVDVRWRPEFKNTPCVGRPTRRVPYPPTHNHGARNYCILYASDGRLETTAIPRNYYSTLTT